MPTAVKICYNPQKYNFVHKNIGRQVVLGFFFIILSFWQPDKYKLTFQIFSNTLAAGLRLIIIILLLCNSKSQGRLSHNLNQIFSLLKE